MIVQTKPFLLTVAGHGRVGYFAYKLATNAGVLATGNLPNGRRELLRLELIHAGHRLGEAVDHYPLVLLLAREADREGHAGEPTPSTTGSWFLVSNPML
jgi:hypothetical protein